MRAVEVSFDGSWLGEQRTTEDTEIAEWVGFRFDILLCFLCALSLLSHSGCFDSFHRRALDLCSNCARCNITAHL